MSDHQGERAGQHLASPGSETPDGVTPVAPPAPSVSPGTEEVLEPEQDKAPSARDSRRGPCHKGRKASRGNQVRGSAGRSDRGSGFGCPPPPPREGPRGPGAPEVSEPGGRVPAPLPP